MLPEIVTLGEAKAFLRLETDETDEDGLIEMLIAAATEAAIAYSDGLEPDATEYPARLKLSILTHVAQAFRDRSAGADVPQSATRLMQPLRTMDV